MGLCPVIHDLCLMVKERYIHVLRKYIPEAAVERIADWIILYGVHLKITRDRSTKLGDFRPSNSARGHHISVNHNLNPYAFLITLVHEFAHLETWVRHGRNVRPHGTEWKQHFKTLMQPFLHPSVFPSQVLPVVTGYLHNPAASSCTDEQLIRVLRQFDDEPALLLADIPDQALFRLKTGRVFRKGQQRRKYFHCIEQESNRPYLVSPLAEVELV